MTTTIKIPRGGSSVSRTRKKELVGYLRETIGDNPQDFWSGPGWQIRIERWVSMGYGRRPLPQLVMDQDSAGRLCMLVDIQDPGLATVVALKFGAG